MMWVRELDVIVFIFVACKSVENQQNIFNFGPPII